ncbi:prepilin-type N-terminal cleavage/methylation domain-containing protein [Evansella halocellulosilytica]|nr:prepilin-type N-terminal cleavage/methylation domain-containing protein [Evansella halocellulosilytica]
MRQSLTYMKNGKGFSMLEVLAAMTILSMIVFVFLGFFPVYVIFS